MNKSVTKRSRRGNAANRTSEPQVIDDAWRQVPRGGYVDVLGIFARVSSSSRARKALRFRSSSISSRARRSSALRRRFS